LYTPSWYSCSVYTFCSKRKFTFTQTVCLRELFENAREGYLEGGSPPNSIQHCRRTRFTHLVSLKHRTHSLLLFFLIVFIFLIALFPVGVALHLHVHALVRNFDGCNLTPKSSVALTFLGVSHVSENMNVISPRPVDVCISNLNLSGNRRNMHVQFSCLGVEFCEMFKAAKLDQEGDSGHIRRIWTGNVRNVVHPTEDSARWETGDGDSYKQHPSPPFYSCYINSEVVPSSLNTVANFCLNPLLSVSSANSCSCSTADGIRLCACSVADLL
jgi:hypothetical protein